MVLVGIWIRDCPLKNNSSWRVGVVYHYRRLYHHYRMRWRVWNNRCSKCRSVAVRGLITSSLKKASLYWSASSIREKVSSCRVRCRSFKSKSNSSERRLVSSSINRISTIRDWLSRRFWERSKFEIYKLNSNSGSLKNWYIYKSWIISFRIKWNNWNLRWFKHSLNRRVHSTNYRWIMID